MSILLKDVGDVVGCVDFKVVLESGVFVLELDGDC